MKKLWINVKRLDLSDGIDVQERLESVTIEDGCNHENLKDTLRKIFSIDTQDVVFKLRNHRGSLIPLNAKIKENNRSMPYTLEAVRAHQFIPCQPKAVQSPQYEEALKKAFGEYSSRLSTLEGTLPDLKARRHDRIQNEMNDLERKLQFLHTRFRDAENSKWEGMFKKSPMW